MMPLWTRATRPALCGWALGVVGAPWVAQRVWPMPMVAFKGSGGEHGLQLADLALGAAAFDLAVDHGGDAGGIVAPVFQPLQAIDQPGNGRARARSRR